MEVNESFDVYTELWEHLRQINYILAAIETLGRKNTIKSMLGCMHLKYEEFILKHNVKLI